MTITTDHSNLNLRASSDLDTLVTTLQAHQARKVDVVVPAATMRAAEALVALSGVEPIITDYGVTDVDGEYAPTGLFVDGLAAKLDVPAKYLHRLRVERPDLFDANINGLLQGRKPKARWTSEGGMETIRPGVPGDTRKFLLRLYAGADGQPGIARSVQSDRYKVTHYLDGVMALLQGLGEAGLGGDDVIITGEITERRLHISVEAPSITAAAPAFLRGYRSPFTGQSGDELNIIRACLRLTDSEVGQGQFALDGGAIALVCRNGMTADIGSFRMRHLGARMDEGVVDFREDTQRANADLIRLQVRDAVSTYLSQQFIDEFAAVLDEKAETRIDGLDKAEEAIKVVGQKLRYTQEQQRGILDMFVRGGQFTSAGVTNAVTAYAQVIDDADEAKRLESTAVQAMSLV